VTTKTKTRIVIDEDEDADIDDDDKDDEDFFFSKRVEELRWNEKRGTSAQGKAFTCTVQVEGHLEIRVHTLDDEDQVRRHAHLGERRPKHVPRHGVEGLDKIHK